MLSRFSGLAASVAARARSAGVRCMSSHKVAGIAGLMQRNDMLVQKIIRHAAAAHPEAEVVTRTVEGPIHRHARPLVLY